MKKVYIYKGFERFWHWTQASLIIFLAFTGFEVHGTFTILGFEAAARYHRTASWMLIVLIAVAIFWHFVTGEWKQYLPTTKKLKEQVLYYAFGMFKGDHHPTQKTQLRKLNPLQRLVYLGFKLFLVPVTIISGILYMLHKTIDQNNIVVVEDIPLQGIAFWHTLGAFLLIVFLVIHVYMTTTGHTPSSNIKAMVTGYEELEDEENDNEEISTKEHTKKAEK
ncbi:MAG: cytochrome b/b6 domain-containing protein [Prolixibacteraceae bacterium]